MLMIRLSRRGKKKQPTYRLIVSEKAKDTFGRALEILGHYNPKSNPKIIDFKADRIKHWLRQGAKASPTVHNFLIDQNIIEGEKLKASSSKKRKKKKAEAEEKPKEGEAPTAEVKTKAEPAEAKPEKPKEEMKPADGLPAEGKEEQPKP